MTEQDGFNNCLQKHKIITNVKDAESWFKKGGCVKFTLPEYSNSRPTNVNNIGVKIVHNCVENNTKDLFDYSNYNFVIIFSGFDENNIEYLCSWHLDYEKKARDDSQDEPKVFHPLFHLTYGGKTMRDIYGNLDGIHSDIKDISIVVLFFLFFFDILGWDKFKFLLFLELFEGCSFITIFLFIREL